jgi:transposase
MRAIGLDVHRDWCDVAIYEDGAVRSCGRVATAPDQLQLFAQSLGPDDQVALETTGNALSIARIIEPHVAGVLVADTRNVRAMTHAKVKNDRVDARMIAKLLAARMLPGVWICDEATRVLRRQIARRTQLVRGRTRARNQIHATLIRNLGGRGPARDILAKKGREWLTSLKLPADERATILSCMREADFLARELAQVDREIARYAVGCAEIRRLMTIPGVDVTTAATLIATIGTHRPLRLTTTAGWLPRPGPPQPPIGPRRRAARPHLKAGLGDRASRALLSRARHDALARPPARVRPTRPRTA